MRSDDELLDQLGRALAESSASPSAGPRPEDVARLRKLADEASARLIAPVVTLEFKRSRAGFVTAAAAAVVAAFALGAVVRDDHGGGPVTVDGVVEFHVPWCHSPPPSIRRSTRCWPSPPKRETATRHRRRPRSCATPSG